MATLEVTGLGISFGGLRAVDDLTMSIEKGGLVGLIGPCTTAAPGIAQAVDEAGKIGQISTVGVGTRIEMAVLVS